MKEQSAQLRQYYRRRDWMISHLGGKCADCNAVDNLEIDHIDPSKKAFNISECYSYAIDTLIEELKKCCLRCSDCHRKKTLAVDGFQAQHGTGGMYRHHGCRCGLCTAANRKYAQDFAARKKAAKELK